MAGTASGTTLVTCNCKSEFQDKIYGPNKRVANNTSKESAICTVCGKEHKGAAPKKK